MSTVNCEVVAVSSETDDIKKILLRPQDGSLCRWQAGAHIRVGLPDGGSRAYSLLRLPGLDNALLAVGVLLEQHSSGGSRFMHALKKGDIIKISPPSNQFKLVEHREHAVLLAGGIGITPILSMAAELAASGRSYEVHYAGRKEGALAFVPEMKEICGDVLRLHFDDQPNALNISSILGNAPQGSHVYFCGPRGMIEAVKSRAAELYWDDAHIHFELFTAENVTGGNTAFEVEINGSGEVVHVPADKSIIEALEEAGLDLLYDCQRGDCGICQCDVIDGIPDHRDVILTDAEKASNKVMQICVSRSKSPRLVLDL